MLRRFLTLFLSFVFGAIAWADLIEVTDLEGRTISIDLLEMKGEKLSFTVPEHGDQEFELPLKKFDDDSQKRLQEAAKELKARMPKLDLNAVIGKRRKKNGYWMIEQTVTAKIIVKNLSRTIDLPETKARIVFIGRSRLNSDYYKILKAENFRVSVRATNQTELEATPYVTRYDSDNRGYGNVGGYQHDAYILAVYSPDDRIIAWQTSDPSFRSALENNQRLISDVMDYKIEAQLNGQLKEIEELERFVR